MSSQVRFWAQRWLGDAYGAYTEKATSPPAPFPTSHNVLTRCNRSIVVVSMKVWVDHMVDDFERVQIDSKKALWEWLSLNHNSDKSYLLVTWKKTNKDRYVSREEVWICHCHLSLRHSSSEERGIGSAVMPLQHFSKTF